VKFKEGIHELRRVLPCYLEWIKAKKRDFLLDRKKKDLIVVFQQLVIEGIVRVR